MDVIGATHQDGGRRRSVNELSPSPPGLGLNELDGAPARIIKAANEV